MRRKPGPLAEFTRGSSNNVPFWPGGFDVDVDTDADDEQLQADVLDGIDVGEYLTCPPG